MQQAPDFDSPSLDPFSLLQDGLAAPQVEIGRGKVLVVSSMVVMLDEGVDLPPEIAGQEIVLQQDAVPQGLVPSIADRRLRSNLPSGLDLLQGLRVI